MGEMFTCNVFELQHSVNQVGHTIQCISNLFNSMYCCILHSLLGKHVCKNVFSIFRIQAKERIYLYVHLWKQGVIFTIGGFISYMEMQKHKQTVTVNSHDMSTSIKACPTFQASQNQSCWKPLQLAFLEGDWVIYANPL